MNRDVVNRDAGGRADVCLVAPYPPTSGSHHAGTSGVASYAANLARALRDAGERVVVVAPHESGPGHDPSGHDPSEQDGPGIEVLRCFDRSPAGIRRACEAAHRTGAPVVHVQLELFLYGGPLAALGLVPSLAGLRRTGRRVVLTLHQAVDPADVDASYTALHRVPVPAPVARHGIAVLQRAVSGAVDEVIVHEQAFRTVVPGARVIPHGVESRGGRDAPGRVEARRRLGLDDRMVALCFGFLAPYKGLEVALGAARRVPEVHLVVAGGEHPRLADAGEDYGRTLRALHPGATFTGWVPGEDVLDWFRAADVALFPYPRPFSSSGALALALAVGTPVLLSAPLARCIGAPSDLVAATEADLATRLRRLARRPDDLARLQAWTDVLADDRRWDRVAARHRAVYHPEAVA